MKRQWAVNLPGEGRRPGVTKCLYADWAVDLSIKGECVFFLMSGSARIDGCLLLVSGPEANAGTRKTKSKEKTGLQEKK